MSSPNPPLCLTVIPNTASGVPNVQTCTGSASEPQWWVSPNPPLVMSPSDWGVVFTALVGVLLAGASVRWAINALHERD